MPPPKNCSFAPRPSVWVVEVSVHESGAASDQTSCPFERWSENFSGCFCARTSILPVESE